MNKYVPARVYVLLARDTPLGVVIRRGPSKRVCTMMWDLTSDTFQMGQWLKGRIFERDSDLSPDGKYLIYYAANSRWDDETRGSWIAVSIAPYLKAIMLMGSWGGGGQFITADRYWVFTPLWHRLLRDSELVQRDDEFNPLEHIGSEGFGLDYWRLVRDGWAYHGRQQPGDYSSIERYEKDLTNGWVLRKLAHRGGGRPVGKGREWEEHVLYFPASGKELPCPDWEWADLAQGRLLWSAHGMLCTGKLDNDGITAQRTLHDFNEMTFERIVAPY